MLSERLIRLCWELLQRRLSPGWNFLLGDSITVDTTIAKLTVFIDTRRLDSKILLRFDWLKVEVEGDLRLIGRQFINLFLLIRRRSNSTFAMMSSISMKFTIAEKTLSFWITERFSNKSYLSNEFTTERSEYNLFSLNRLIVRSNLSSQNMLLLINKRVESRSILVVKSLSLVTYLRNGASDLVQDQTYDFRITAKKYKREWPSEMNLLLSWCFHVSNSLLPVEATNDTVYAFTVVID